MEEGKQTSGEKEGHKPWTLREFGGKPIWDWLQLVGVLAIPVVIAVGGCMFNAAQNTRLQEIESQRAQAERELAEQRAQDEALQACLDQMSTLMLEKDLRDSASDSEVRTLAHTRTLTLLDSLDAQRRRAVLRFLYEANLIDRSGPVIELDGANLRDMDLQLVNLSGGAFDLPTTYGTNRGAEFGSGGADLSGADLSGVNLSYGSLQGATLQGANFEGANLTGCGFTPDLSNVSSEDLGRAEAAARIENPPDAPLGVNLVIQGHVPIPEGAVKTNLEGAFFNNANLRYAVFQNADLSGADLISANSVHQSTNSTPRSYLPYRCLLPNNTRTSRHSNANSLEVQMMP